MRWEGAIRPLAPTDRAPAPRPWGAEDSEAEAHSGTAHNSKDLPCLEASRSHGDQDDSKRLTWQKIARAEPRLRDLLDEVRSTERDIWATREDGVIHMYPYRSVRVYLDLIKPTVVCLAGWGRRRGPDFLQTREAYDLAIKKLWDALPYDFDEDELEEAWELAHEIDLDEGDWVALAGPEAA